MSFNRHDLNSSTKLATLTLRKGSSNSMKRKSRNENAGLTDRQAIREAKRISLSEKSDDTPFKLAHEDMAKQAAPTNLAAQVTGITSGMSSSNVNSSPSPIPPADSHLTCYPSLPRTFQAWYQDLVKHATPLPLKGVKPYIPQPSESMFKFFKEQYQTYYGQETTEEFQPKYLGFK